jgi:urea transporter
MLGYFLMLAIMTFNVYISIAVILGSGIGYYVFGLILLKLNVAKIKKRHRLAQCNPVCTGKNIQIIHINYINLHSKLYVKSALFYR